MRASGWVMLVWLVLALAPQTGSGDELRIAAWNLEHLDDSDGVGCVGRSDADYVILARRIAELDADIVAFQEVENEMAAHRVFPASDWHVEVSRRPPMESSPACWDRPQAELGHLATGFAIRRGVQYRRNGDLTSLGAGDAFQRWGTDIVVTSQGRELRLLSVHLRTGCWGAGQDGDSGSTEICATLRGQIEELKAWADVRQAQAQAFVILGDFNRRLTLADDWAWRLLSPASAPLLLLTKDVPFRCDPRFPAFIDHMVAGGGAQAMLAPGSFREAPRRDPHPDHCAISAVFRFGN
ncbi:MAG: endonuclease/exonuclease/phosphatase family protein [bacterium]|nr:endonuclease/exonuclease/phosphatase family protein [bacterium]